jgi:hypothetical protein
LGGFRDHLETRVELPPRYTPLDFAATIICNEKGTATKGNFVVTIQAFCLRQNNLMARSFKKSFCHQIILPLFLLFAVTHLNSYIW